MAKLTISPDGVVPVPSGRGFERLTASQLKVLALVAQGLTNKAIAHRLGVCESTVKTHIMRAAASHGRPYVNRVTLALWYLACCPTEEFDEIVEDALPPLKQKQARHS